jgi:hypothetical protein
LAEDSRSRGFRRWALVLLAVVATTLVRVVAMASTILLVPLAHVEDVARVVVIANTIVDRWGLVPRFLLF